MISNPHDQVFDEYAEGYSDCVNRAIAISGEDKDYFARARVLWTKRYLDGSVGAVMDYGCGVGSLVHHLLELLIIDSVVGIDVSQKSIELARKTFAAEPRADFFTFKEFRPTAEFDLTFACNVFHHLGPDERPDALEFIRNTLRTGGLFALWEQNPWNPGTRYIMRQCEFDRDAETLRPGNAKELLEQNGFKILRTDFLFIFPRFLRLLRPLEPLLSSLPLGAQYLVLAQKS